MDKLAIVLKRLKRAGYKVQDKLEVESDVEFLGVKDLICQYDAKFAVKYFKDGHFEIETTWSNQVVTEKFFTELKQLRSIIK